MLCQSSPTVRSLPYHPFNSDGNVSSTANHRGMSTSSSASSSRRNSGSGPTDASTSSSSASTPTASSSQQQPSFSASSSQQQHSVPSHSPARPRHHARSVSQEASRFPSVTAFNLSPPRRPSHGSQGSHHLKMSISQNLPPTATAAAAAATPGSSTSSSASTPLSSSNGSSNNTSPDRDDENDDCISPASSTAVSSTEGSPVALRTTVSALPGDDESRLRALLEAQASRRPRLMRLTPAYASMPNRIPQTLDASSKSSRPALPFPTSEGPSSQVEKDESASTSVIEQIRGQPRTPPLEPPTGLSLDMTNLPKPAIGDASAPQSTSSLPNEVRTKSGRLIKPALRNSSFVGGTSGGRVTRMNRSDSMPASAASSAQMRAKSTPNTPSVAKVVQFDSHLEHIKVFKFKQKPTAISRSGSPEQTETETEEERELFPFVNYGRKGPSPPSGTPNATSPTISSIPGQAPVEEQLVLRLPNFPSSARLSVDKTVFLERIYLAEDLRSVKGTVRVRNISFEKWVAIRFTLDNWVTVNEVSAEYSESLADGSADRFAFSIKLNELLDWPRGAGQHETKTMFLCLRYTTCDGQHWDNNDGLNYQLDFRKRQLPSTPMPTPNATRPSTRAQTLSGPMSTQQARVIEMVRRHGVQSGKGSGGFVEDLRRELDKLKSDEEDHDRLPIITKKMAAAVASSGAVGGPVAGLRQKRSTASPPGSPGPRGEGPSPMWSARYDWNESLRNSASSSARSRPAVYDYFNSKPPPPASAMGDADPAAPHLFVSAASPPSQNSSVVSTPMVSNFGQTRAGMLSPAVGDVFAHHQPVTSPSLSNSLASSVEGSAANSVSNSPDRFYAASLGIAAASRDGRLSPGDGNSPTQRSPPGGNKFFSFAPLRRGHVSPLASGQTSLENSDSDEEEDQVDDTRESSRAPAPARIVTLPRATIKARQKKDDGLVLENYDSPPVAESPTRPMAVSHMSDSSLFSPSTSVSSMESETSDLVTPDVASIDGLPTSFGSTGTGSGSSARNSSISSSNGGSGSDDASHVSTPRIVSQRRWSPPGSIISPADKLPTSAADLSELIQKYCWSSDSVPGLGLGLGGGAGAALGIGSGSGSGSAGGSGNNSGNRSRTGSPSPRGFPSVGGVAATIPGSNAAGLPSPLHQSGSATPTGEF